MDILGIDAGHGGADKGAIANGVVETEANIHLARMLKHFVNYLPINWQATLIRERDDEDLNFSERAKRAEGCSLVVSIHHNANSNFLAHGLETYYLPGNGRMAMACEKIQRCAPEALYVTRRKPREADVTDGEWLQRPRNVLESYSQDALLVECGFLTNSEDARSVQSLRVQQGICLAIVQGIL